MFDWDTDYEGVVQTRVLKIHEVTGPAGPSRLAARSFFGRSLFGRWLMAGAVALGLAGAAWVAVAVPSVPAFASRVGWPALTPMLVPVKPAGLHAYDDGQFAHFHRGIARFSDADLLDYARETERMLTGHNPMAAFTRDALFLTHREIDRRGLRRPMDSLRAAFSPS